RLADREHVAVGEPGRAALAAGAGVEPFGPQPRLELAHARAVVPDEDRAAAVEGRDVLEGGAHLVERLARLGAVDAHDDLVEVGDAPKGFDDALQRRVPELVVETGKDERDRAAPGVTADFRLEPLEGG